MSAPVSAIARAVQVGVEATEGLAASANRKLSSLSIGLAPSIETDPFRPHGNKFPTIISLGKDWSEGSLEGKATYTEIVYPLSTILSYAAPTVIGATTAYKWVFSPAVSAEDVTKTLTVEWGREGAGNARKAVGCFANEFGLEWSRSGVNISGTVLGRRTTKGETLTAAPTALALIPVLPTQVNVYMDSTWATLGTTQLLDVTAGNFTIGDRFAPWWTLNSANNSFAAKVEAEPSTELALRMAANAVGYGYLDDIRAQGTKFIRIEAVGGVANGAENYRLRCDFAAQYNAAAGEDDEDGALVLEAPMTIVADPTSGNAIRIEVTNLLTAL